MSIESIEIPRIDESTMVWLACPQCGEDGHLHQGEVRITHRLREDGPGIETIVSDNRGLEPMCRYKSSRDIPHRRDSLIIQFTCENCSYDAQGNGPLIYFELEIYQHKGATYLAWAGLKKRHGATFLKMHIVS